MSSQSTPEEDRSTGGPAVRVDRPAAPFRCLAAHGVADGAYDEVRAVAADGRVSLREAAFMLAIRRVAEAVRLRGI